MEEFLKKMFRFSYPQEGGQVILLVVLIMVVAMTVGLSVASRNVVQIRTSSEEANSQQAFSAAETGIEQALIGKNAQGQSIGNATISTVSIQQSQGSSILLNNGNLIHKDEGIDVWLTTYPNYGGTAPSGKVTFYWGNSANPCNDAALNIIVIQGPVATPTMKHLAVDHTDCGSRQTKNHFTTTSAGGIVGGQTFNYSTSIIYTNALIIRVIPIYADSVIGVVNVDNTNAPVALPSQGQIITATGTSGGTSRKLLFFQPYESVPAAFYYTLFQP